MELNVLKKNEFFVLRGSHFKKCHLSHLSHEQVKAGRGRSMVEPPTPVFPGGPQPFLETEVRGGGGPGARVSGPVPSRPPAAMAVT